MMAGGLMAGVSGAIATRLLRNPSGSLNDREREMWVQNDEGLYNWWKQSRLSMRAFLRENRAELDAAILRVLNAPPREKTWRDYAGQNPGSYWTAHFTPYKPGYSAYMHTFISKDRAAARRKAERLASGFSSINYVRPATSDEIARVDSNHSNRGGRWYVGLGKGHDRSVFFSRHKPTEKSYSSRFLAVVGPYKSKAEASSKSALMNPLTDAESAKSLHNNRAKHHRNTILPMMAGGLMAGVSGAIATRLLRNSSPVLSGIAKDGVLYKVARKSSTGEWCVTAYVPVAGGGWKRHEGKTYYGDSKEDAVGTFNYIMGPKGPTMMNPLSSRESAVILRDSRAWLRAGRRIKATTTHPDWGEADYQRGRVDGLTQTVLRYGPRRARRLATKIYKKAGFLANPGSVRAYRVPSGYEAKVASTLRNLFVWAQAQDGRVLTIGKPSIVAKVIRHVCGKKVGTALKNPGGSPENKGRGFYVMGQHTSVAWSLTRADAEREAKRLNYRGGTHYTVVPVGPHPGGGTGALKNSGTEQNVIDVPFGQGKKYSIAQVQKWVETHGTPAMKKRFAMAMTQYKRFHKGSLPKFITYSTYKMGSHPGISDVEFGVSEGHEWMAAYQVPRSSGKWVDQASGGRYVHAHGDSDIDVDVKKPVNLSKLPMRFHTPDGKAVGVIPSKNVKIGEWYEG
jgi:hypothetical protein